MFKVMFLDFVKYFNSETLKKLDFGRYKYELNLRRAVLNNLDKSLKAAPKIAYNHFEESKRIIADHLSSVEIKISPKDRWSTNIFSDIWWTSGSGINNLLLHKVKLYRFLVSLERFLLDINLKMLNLADLENDQKKRKRTLWLIRHAEREDGGDQREWANDPERNPGQFHWDNPPLSMKGLDEAKRLGERSEFSFFGVKTDSLLRRISYFD